MLIADNNKNIKRLNMIKWLYYSIGKEIIEIKK